MLKIEVLGNLGADAEVKNHNGSEFISFRVASTNKWTDSENLIHSDTTWCSCTMSVDSGKNVMPYMKKGTKVFVRGNVNFNVFSSPKTKQMEVGVNIRVMELELASAAEKKEENK